MVYVQRRVLRMFAHSPLTFMHQSAIITEMRECLYLQHYEKTLYLDC